MALTVWVTDWSGLDYAEISDLQRAMITNAMADLTFSADDRVLDIGCGDGFLTRMIAGLTPDGFVVGVDASPRMILAATGSAESGSRRPDFVVADACYLPFGPTFDAVVSFNALHWVPQQARALGQIAAVLKPGGRATVQMVCAGATESVESVATRICQTPAWAPYFGSFEAPFVHPDPDDYGVLADAQALACEKIGVTERQWDFGTRADFARWCAVGSTAWTDQLPIDARGDFIAEMVDTYENVTGRPGLFRFTQMRAEFRR